jgi:hypothetical protein
MVLENHALGLFDKMGAIDAVSLQSCPCLFHVRDYCPYNRSKSTSEKTSILITKNITIEDSARQSGLQGLAHTDSRQSSCLIPRIKTRAGLHSNPWCGEAHDGLRQNCASVDIEARAFDSDLNWAFSRDTRINGIEYIEFSGFGCFQFRNRELYGCQTGQQWQCPA